MEKLILINSETSSAILKNNIFTNSCFAPINHVLFVIPKNLVYFPPSFPLKWSLHIFARNLLSLYYKQILYVNERLVVWLNFDAPNVRQFLYFNLRLIQLSGKFCVLNNSFSTKYQYGFIFWIKWSSLDSDFI